MANYLTTDTELTNIANAIRNKNGTTATLQWPSDYITAIEDIETGGGQPFACINVTYPAGSICTATNGTTTLTAANTSGQVVFGIPEPTSSPETWTISCTNGTNIYNKDIDIISYGQNESILIAYCDPILNNNSWATISTIAKAGTGEYFWDIGDCKQIKLNGTIGTLTLSNYTTYVFILDFNHPINRSTPDNNIIFGGFKTALTNGKDICLKDSGYGSKYNDGTKYFNINHYGSGPGVTNSNYGGWKGCDFRYDILGATSTAPKPYNTLKTTSTTGYNGVKKTITSPVANTLMKALPSDFRSVLRLWNRYINSSKDDNSCSTPTVDAGISLLTETELYGSTPTAVYQEFNYQMQMKYYLMGNSKTKYNQTSTSGVLTTYWLASPYNYYASAFCYFSDDRYSHSDGTATSCSLGLSPAFKV